MFTLFNLLTVFCLFIMIGLFSGNKPDKAVGAISTPTTIAVIAFFLYVLAMLIPSLSVGTRRLHDTGKSGWWMWLALIPFIGWLVLFIFFVKNSEWGSNKYGDNPKGMGNNANSPTKLLSTPVIANKNIHQTTNNNSDYSIIKNTVGTHCDIGNKFIIFIAYVGANTRELVNLYGNKATREMLGIETEEWKESLISKYPSVRSMPQMIINDDAWSHPYTGDISGRIDVTSYVSAATKHLTDKMGVSPQVAVKASMITANNNITISANNGLGAGFVAIGIPLEAAAKVEAEEYFSKGAALGQAQEWSEAIKALNEAVRLNPDHAKAHMSLVMCYGGIMDFDSARKHYEILKKLDLELASRLANTPAGALLLRGGGVIRM